MHDNLVRELRQRQRNIVFPDTVRNEGVFYRSLAGKSVHGFASHRAFAVLFGLCLLLINLLLPAITGVIKAISSFQNLDWIIDLSWIVSSLLWIVIGLKISVNALVPYGQQPNRLPPKSNPRVKI